MADQSVNPFSPPKADLEGGPVVAGSFQLATRGSRLAAALLDGLLTLPALAVLGFGTMSTIMASRAGTAPAPGGGMPAMAMGLAGLYFLALGIFQIYRLSTRGQTLGKGWMKIKIVKVDGSAPGFVGAFLLRVFVNAIPSAIPYIGGIYGLVDTLMIFRQDQRCIHDMIAGTRVVVA